MHHKMRYRCPSCNMSYDEDGFYHQMKRGVKRRYIVCKGCTRIKRKNPHRLAYLVFSSPKPNKATISRTVRERIARLEDRFSICIVDGTGSIPVWEWHRKPLRSTNFTELVAKDKANGRQGVIVYEEDYKERGSWPPPVWDLLT